MHYSVDVYFIINCLITCIKKLKAYEFNRYNIHILQITNLLNIARIVDAAQQSSQFYVGRHQRDSLSVQCAAIRILHQLGDVQFAGLLQCLQSLQLYANIKTAVCLQDFTNQPIEGCT